MTARGRGDTTFCIRTLDGSRNGSKFRSLSPSFDAPPHFLWEAAAGKNEKEGTQGDEKYRASGDTSYTALKEKRLRDQSGFIALLRRKREKWTEGKKSLPQKSKEEILGEI